MKSWKHISTAQVDAIDDWTVPTFVSVDVDSGGSEVGGGTTPASLLLAAPGQSSSTTTLPKSTMIAVDDVGGETRGNRRQRHLRRLRDHKERLRWLTDRFANASKASLVVGQRSSMESTARSTTMASVTRAKGDADAANATDANDNGMAALNSGRAFCAIKTGESAKSPIEVIGFVGDQITRQNARNSCGISHASKPTTES